MRIIVRGQELFLGDIIRTVEGSTQFVLYRKVEYIENMVVGRILGSSHYLYINDIKGFEVVFTNGKKCSKEDPGLT